MAKSNKDDPLVKAWSIITKQGKIKASLDPSLPQFQDFLRQIDQQAGMFMCGGTGSFKAIPLHYINDDFCDCEDASDEPFTSACSGLGIHNQPQQKQKERCYMFSCESDSYLPSSLRGSARNEGKRRFLPPSLINDGTCDW